MKTLVLSTTLFAMLFASGGHILYTHICKIDSGCETEKTLSAFELPCESKAEQKKSCHEEVKVNTENSDCCDVIQQFDAQNQINGSFSKLVLCFPPRKFQFTFLNHQAKVKKVLSTHLNKPPPRLKIRYHIAFQQFIC